jgi:hypothetical protein
MRHDPRTGIFSGSYLNEKVRFDVQSAFLDWPSMDGLTKAFTHMSLTCDPRAPKHVPQEVNPAPQDLITLDSIGSTQFCVSNNRGVGTYTFVCTYTPKGTFWAIGTYTLKGAFTLKGTYETEGTFLTLPLFCGLSH